MADDLQDDPAFEHGLPSAAGEAANLLALLVAHLTDAVMITEGDDQKARGRRIVFVNPAFTAMTGYTSEESIGRTPDFTIGPETDRSALQRIGAARDRLEPVREEVLKYRKDGTKFWAELDIVPVCDAAGRCTHYVGVMRDITARKDLQSRMIISERLAALGTLASGVAHQMNNPLGYVVGNLDVVEEELAQLVIEARERHDAASDARLRAVVDALADAREGALRASQVVRDLQAFCSTERESQESCDLHAVLASAVRIASNEIRHRARLVEAYGPAPPVVGSFARLGQVFLNLLLNAAQAIPRGHAAENEITIEVGTDAGGDAFVVVRDTGVGIPEDALARVFDPFFTTRPVGIGTGLGLSICHGIVSALGGDISVESDPGRGSAFRVRLPAGGQSRVRKASSLPVVLGSRGRVLLIDDDPLALESLRRMLQTAHDVVAVTRGRDAIARLQKGDRFDAVLCDVMMPEMSGAEVYADLAAFAPEQLDRIAFLTGGAFGEEAERFVEGLSRPLLRKPIRARKLREVVARLVRGAFPLRPPVGTS